MRITILSLLISIQILYSQSNIFEEKQFFSDLRNSYYNLNDTNIQNFTALVTSLKMENFAKDVWKNEEIFPIQIIWFKPDRIYLAQQGIPTLPEDKYKEYQELVEGIKQQVKAILLNFERFYITGIYYSINSTYNITHNDKYVWITSNAKNEDSDVPVKYTMGRNGLCLEIEIFYPSQNKKIIISPTFKIIKTKWLCTGWKVQNLIAEEPVSGYSLEISYNEYQSIWIPIQILINVQKKEEPGTTYYDVIKFKNYMFNQPLELQEGANPNH